MHVCVYPTFVFMSLESEYRMCFHVADRQTVRQTEKGGTCTHLHIRNTYVHMHFTARSPNCSLFPSLCHADQKVYSNMRACVTHIHASINMCFRQLDLQSVPYFRVFATKDQDRESVMYQTAGMKVLVQAPQHTPLQHNTILCLTRPHTHRHKTAHVSYLGALVRKNNTTQLYITVG